MLLKDKLKINFNSKYKYTIHHFFFYFQCYDINGGPQQSYQSNNDLSDQHCTTVSMPPQPPLHGPPPSYETVVAMDQGIDAGCTKCSGVSRHHHQLSPPPPVHCPFMRCNDYKSKCNARPHWSPNCDDLSDDDGSSSARHHHQDQSSHRPHIDCQISRSHSCHHQSGVSSGCCQSDTLTDFPNFDLIKKCKRCGKEIDESPSPETDDNNGNSIVDYCQCFSSPVLTAQQMQISAETNGINGNDLQDDERSMMDPNGNPNDESIDDDTVNLETFNDNGLIRMDMSQIIDQTGLPTYEAAIKLESSGYV